MNRQVLLILAVLAAAYLYTNGYITPGSSVGFSTLSLTQGTTYVSSDPFFNSPTYTLAVAVDGSSGSARGTFTPADVGAYTGQNRPAGNFDLVVENQNQSCTYTLLSQPISVYTYSTFRGCCTTNCYSQCTFNTANKVGEIYSIDSVAHYDSSVKVALVNGAQEYATHLSPTKPTDEIPGTVRASFVGSLLGVQSCPVPATTTVLYRPAGTNQLQPKSAAYLPTMTILGSPDGGGNYMGEQPLTNPPQGYTTDSANNMVTRFLGSSPSQTAYCENPTFNGQDTAYRCQPASPVAIPLLKLYVKASVLGVVVPSSQPKIVSVSTPTIEAAKTTKFTITLKNAGTETDSYDLAIIGAKQVNLQSTRVSLAAGEEQVVPVFIQAAGIIGNYTITATSVNNPTLKDTYSFRLLAEPFCDKQPEAGKIRIATEYGCYYICPNPLDSDQREATCQIFGTFEQSGKPYNRSYAENNNNTKSYANEYHCIAVGKYISLNDYMDDVSTGQRQIFTANSKPNAFWLPAPVCNYVAAYGWHWDGSAADYVESEDYDYSKVPPAGSLVANNTPTASQSSTAQQAIPQLPTGDAGIAVIALIAAIVAWKLVLRR